MPLKIDLHVHTCYSNDGKTTLKEVIAYSQKRGLDGIAITDHDTIRGALQIIRKTEGLLIIPGIEVSTKKGHILGLNVTTPIASELEPEETVRQIHDAGGIAVAAHPSAIYKEGLSLGISTNISGIDAIEVVNSASFPFFLLTYLNRRIATSLSLPQTAGSDSHIPETIGLAYTLIEANPNLEEIIQSIKKGAITPCGKPVPWKLRLKKLIKSRKK